MTVCSVPRAMERIKAASSESPLAVFTSEDGRLDVVIADTVLTQNRIERGDLNYVGTYDKTMDPARVRAELAKTLRTPEPPRMDQKKQPRRVPFTGEMPGTFPGRVVLP